MIDYSNGKIYILKSDSTNCVYIGSTCSKLCVRMANHRYHNKLYLKKKIYYMSSFDMMKYDDTYIELIEEYACNSREELHTREGEIMEQYPNRCNRQMAGGGPKAACKRYYQKNRIASLAKSKARYEKNKKTINDKAIARYNTKEGKKKARRYYKINRVKILKKYHDNKV